MSDANDPEGSQPPTETVYEEKKSSPMGWIVGLLVAVLAIVAIVAIVSNDDDSDSSDTSPPGTGINVDINVGTDDSGGPAATDGG